MSNIHNYPLTATQINDEDFYDVDYWNGVAYETRKISGASLKSVLSGAEQLNDLLDVDTQLPGVPTNADDGRVLYFDIDTGKWISDDIANIANVVKDCKTTAGNTIPKGTPIALSGFDNDLLVVVPADASNPALMPCIGIAAETIDDTNAKKAVSFGKLQGVDTSAFIDGDVLYVAAGGGLTTTRPTGTAQIQRIASVLKSDNPGGLLKVFNTSRTAGLPNLQPGNIWHGDSDSYPEEIPLCPPILSDLFPGDIIAICRWNGSSYDRFAITEDKFTQNIYNSDGTLTGNRIVNIDTFAMVFQIGGYTLIRMQNPAQPEFVIGGITTPTNYTILEVQGQSSHFGLITTNQNGFWLELVEGINRLTLNGTLTGNRNQLFQDADGTIALLSDIVNLYNSDGTLTGNRNLIGGGFSLNLVGLNNLLQQVSPASPGVPAWELDIDTSAMAGGDQLWKLRDTTAGLDVLQFLKSGLFVINNSYALPAADGNPGEVLTTDGAGSVTFQPAGAPAWYPPFFQLYDGTISGGASTLLGAGQGYYVVMNGTGTPGRISWNMPLNIDGTAYDGSLCDIYLLWQLSTNGGGNVEIDVISKFTTADGTTDARSLGTSQTTSINVTGRNTNALYRDKIGQISGAAAAHALTISIERATGGGLNNDTAHFIGMEIIKL